MKVELEDKIIDCSVYYIIGILKNDTHFTGVVGDSDDDMENIHLLMQGMMGSIESCIKDKQPGNALLLMTLIRMAVKKWPEIFIEKEV